MKEITYSQLNPQYGKIKGHLRIIGKLLFFKFNNNQYSQQIIQQLKARGANIDSGKGWIKVDMFGDNEVVKLGGKEINMQKTSSEELEVILCDFYKAQYTNAKFKVEEL